MKSCKKMLCYIVPMVLGMVFSISSLAQERLNKTKEIIILKDNDFFIPYTEADKDYSFGIKGAFRFVGDTAGFLFKSRVKRLIHEFSGGIMGFTPDHNLDDFDPNNNTGRPFAGWLYVGYAQYLVFNTNYLNLGIQAGVMGPHSYAGNFQNWFHQELKAGPYVPGWDKQIPDQVGVNIEGEYLRQFKKKEKVLWYGDLRGSIGNIFSNIESSIAFRYGNFSDLHNFSRLTDSSPEGKQVFVDFKLGLFYNGYDASLQGNIFKQKTFFEIQKVNTISITGAMSFTYIVNRFSFVMLHNFRSSALDDGRRFQYGSLILSYSL